MSKLSRISALTRMFAMTLATAFSLSPVAVLAADEAEETSSTQTGDPALSMPSPWPMKVNDSGRTFLIYQPQVDKWENTWLEGRCAVSIRNDASGKQNFGVLFFSARTELDQKSRTVFVHDAVISKADFPALAGGVGVEDYLSVLRPQLAAQSWRVAQERLQSDMEIDKLAEQSAKQPFRNDPPRILYSDRPAVLVPVDGNPVLRPVADTGLRRVTNTRALILQDRATSRYFLFVSDHWMEAPSLDGPWLVTANPSAQLEQAKQLATQQDQVDLLDADAEEGAVMPASVSVFVSTTPTELLQTDGPAQYAPIERTQLLYVTNSPNKLFLDLTTQYHYALISGRWYRTTTLAQGQWSYVPAASLPGDFAMIPAEHPTESVRAAVPGTPQAREAVIANSVPQVATVTRSAAHLEITYDGNPVFQPIEGTDLQNAVNSPVPVIRVSEESFYALDNGVWFVAPTPFGPWAVTSYVPSVIYSIPRSSPLYNVTYVRVYDATPEVVYVGYTPGYVGSYVSSDYVVVYGTGWPYSPWIGSVWYGAPITWGFGFSFFHSWWHPYPWHWHRSAWGPPRPYYRPWWGPWYPRPHYGAVATNVTVNNNVIINDRNMPPSNVADIYNRWDRQTVVRNRDIESPRLASQPRPRRDAITSPDVSRQQLGDGDRRDGRERNRSTQRRDDANLPPIQSPRRRADNITQPVIPGVQPRAELPRAELPRAELPRIQGPNRRGDREDNAQRIGRDRPAWRNGEDGRVQRPQPTVHPEQRDDTGPGRRSITQPQHRDVTPQQRNEAGSQARREFERPQRADMMQRERRDAVQEDRGNAPRIERRDVARPERRDFPDRAQSRMERPRDNPPAAMQSMPQSPPIVQSVPRVQQPVPQQTSPGAAPSPRIERDAGGPQRREARQQLPRVDGNRRGNADGGGFRPEAR